MPDNLNEKVVPFIAVADGDVSVAFYCDDLGFTKEWVYQPNSESPRCVCVTLGTAKLYLSESDETAKGIKFVIWVDDIESLLQRCRDRNLDFEFGEQGHFCTREVRIKDPDDNDILLSERPEDGP